MRFEDLVKSGYARAPFIVLFEWKINRVFCAQIEFPIVEIVRTETGTNLGTIKGPLSVLKIMWTQTYPIFLPPLLTGTVILSSISAAVFFIAHGLFLW